MASFYDELNESIGGDVTSQLQNKYNLNPEQARGAFDAIGPLVLGGLKRQKEEGGEERLGDLLDQHADDGALDDLDGYFTKRGEAEDLDPGLGGILGARGAEAGQAMEQQLGLSSGMGAKLIPLLAPLIMGMLKKKGRSGGGGGGGGGGSMGMIGGLLDRDGDGNILDDIGGMLMKGGGGLASGGAGKSGCLGMLLGGRK